MPPTSRKRSAQAGSDIQSSSKRTQANKLDPEDVSRIANSEEDEIEEAESKLKPKLKKSQKTSAILASTATLTGSTPASTAAAKTVTTKSVKAKASEADPVSTISPKRTRKPIKTGSVKLEEEDEDEEQVDTNAQASKKSRKRKAANEEETGGLGVPDKSEEAASPKKPKRKRKTQEKKDAEAMPLATRTAGLGMFIGAHVSGAKGALSGGIDYQSYIEGIDHLIFVSLSIYRCTKCCHQLCAYWVSLPSPSPCRSRIACFPDV